MKLKARITNALFRLLFRMFIKLDIKEFEKVPREGPFMLIANHTSALDGPIMYVFMQPRKMVAMAKQELWKHWFTRYVMNLWESIPVDRENMSRQTMESCFGILDRGDILAIAPEGTRSSDGKLQQGKAGVAFIAHKKQVPMVPVANIGLEKIPQNIKRLRRTPVTFFVGEPFEIVRKEGRLDAAGREQLIEEIMLRLAQLLPPEYRGYYADHEPTYLLTREITESSALT